MPAFHDTLPMVLNVALDAIMPAYRELFARHGLTEQQWRILRVLWAEGEVTTTHLARQTLLPAPSLVGILDRLEKRGLVARTRSTADRRKVHVASTAAGRALHEAVTPALERLHAHVTGAVSVRDWQAMRDTLDRIQAAMDGVGLDDIAAEDAATA